ncbi:MAG: hypothetical protein H7A24_17135 [Leptospiraceae bacterium]|nr:hypothetical protein [Leptospiraceae bacterium]
MYKSIKLLINTFILLPLSLTNCTTFDLSTSIKNQVIKLASKKAKCLEPITIKNWTILYGTVPLTFLNQDPDRFIKGRSFRLKEKAEALDIALSLLLGFTTSISVKTIIIENCETNSPSPVNQESILPKNNSGKTDKESTREDDKCNKTPNDALDKTNKESAGEDGKNNKTPNDTLDKTNKESAGEDGKNNKTPNDTIDKTNKESAGDDDKNNKTPNDALDKTNKESAGEDGKNNKTPNDTLDITNKSIKRREQK